MAASTVAGGALSIGPRTARAAWGELSPSPFAQGNPDAKILEIFIYGGLAPWESFYHQPWAPDPWHGLQAEVEALPWACADAPVDPQGNVQTMPLAVDASMNTVHLGPFTKPLWSPAILDRMRVVVMRHDLEPHEAAVPLAMTGRRLGNANMAGLGAAVQHRFGELSPQTTPHAYVVRPSVLRAFDNLTAIGAVGTHGSASRPLVLKIGAAQGLLGQLDRSARETGADELLVHLHDQYVDQTRWASTAGPRTRSRGLAGYESALEAIRDAPALTGVLSGATLTSSSTVSCMAGQSGANTTAASLQTAAHLLGPGGARYVGVIDGGHFPLGDTTGYDTHSSSHAFITGRNLWNTLSTLADLIANGSVDLDDTIVVLNTEFGRSPGVEGSSGRSHWPHAYVNVLIGGPVGGGPSIAGAIDSNGFVPSADTSFGPSDVHAAVMLAASIDPFAAGNFNQGNVSGHIQNQHTTDAAISLELASQILGV